MAAKKPELPYPWKSWKTPDALEDYENGKLPADILKPIRGGGVLWVTAADDWNRMCRDMRKDGVMMQTVSRGYRPYGTQLAMWVKRWQRKPSPRKPEITKIWNQELWYLKQGASPSAAPGTSPHGWGCAQDILHTDKKLFRWMCLNAPKYNFYLQAAKDSKWREDWHWHWIEPEK